MIEISPDFHIVQATTEEQFQQCMTVRMKGSVVHPHHLSGIYSAYPVVSFAVFVEEQGYDAKIEQDELGDLF